MLDPRITKRRVTMRSVSLNEGEGYEPRYAAAEDEGEDI